MMLRYLATKLAASALVLLIKHLWGIHEDLEIYGDPEGEGD